MNTNIINKQRRAAVGAGREWGAQSLILSLLALAADAKSLQSCLTLRPHRWQPSRLLCPWDSPGKSTGVGCHFPLQCMKVKSESEVAQSYLTLSDPTSSPWQLEWKIRLPGPTQEEA